MRKHRELALPDPLEMQERYPILPSHAIAERRGEIESILSGQDPKRLMMIVGPCSAWPFDAVRTYADRLTRLQKDLREHLLLVMRCYVQKPRTTVGWEGPLTQPEPGRDKPKNIPLGIEKCSHMMWDIGQQLPLADEALHTHNAGYFERFLSYTAVGARSSEDQDHRNIASGLDHPAGIKNPTSGSIEIGINGVLSAQKPHTYPEDGYQVRTDGNPYAHLILRGGNGCPNYDPNAIATAGKLMTAKQILNPAIVIDASHDNALNGHGKDPELQEIVVDSVMAGIRRNRPEYRIVKGFMIESFLKKGKQSEDGPDYDMDGLSITDPCLGWEQTEILLRDIAERHAARRTS